MVQPPLQTATPRSGMAFPPPPHIRPDTPPELPRDENRLPTSFIVDLSEGEHLVVWMFRRLAVARIWCPVIDHEISRLLRKHEDDIRKALQHFLAELAHNGRRRLRIGMPGYPVMTEDEQLLLAILAAAQMQDLAHLDAMLPFLLGRADIAGILKLVTVIGMGFAANGRVIRHPPLKTSNI